MSLFDIGGRGEPEVQRSESIVAVKKTHACWRCFFYPHAHMHTEKTSAERCLEDVSFEVGRVWQALTLLAAADVAQFVFSLCWNVPAAWENNNASAAPAERCLPTPLQTD